MTIFIGADHRGFALKEKLKAALSSEAYDVRDVGAATYVADDDYPDFAEKVAKGVLADPEGSRGIAICGSGFGVDIAINKFRGIRAALPSSPDQIYIARHDDDVNVIALAADFTDDATAEQIVKTFLSTPFAKEEERYRRRLDKIAKF